MKAVIMAGGEGVRLRPFTYMIPKPLLPVGNITVLENMIQVLKNCGCTEVLISINYQSKQFEDWLYNWKKNEGGESIKLLLLKEKKKLGTAGSLRLMEDHFTEPFCVLNGDLIIKVRLDEMLRYHNHKNADITLGIKQYNLTLPYAIINEDNNGKLINIREKPTYTYSINSGIYILSPSILKNIPYGQCVDMPGLINSLKKAGRKIVAYDIGDYWLDMGQISDYEIAINLIEKWRE